MPTGSAAFFFDFGEIGALVPVRFGVVVVGNGVEARCLSGAASNDSVGHTDDGGGVPAATQLREDGAIGTEFAPDGCCEDAAEVLFVFGVRSVTDFLFWIEIPILAYSIFPGSQEHERGWRDRMDANAGCQMHGW